MLEGERRNLTIRAAALVVFFAVRREKEMRISMCLFESVAVVENNVDLLQALLLFPPPLLSIILVPPVAIVVAFSPTLPLPFIDQAEIPEEGAHTET